jgi:quercetin dioxygenase-like cupin family protein
MKYLAAHPGSGIEHTAGNEGKSMTTEGFSDDGTMLKDLAQFDLLQEIKVSEQNRPWTMGHFARTLFKKSDLRVVLISMDKGSILKEHHADGGITVQVLKGSIRFTAQGEVHTLGVNSILTLGASIKHQVEADEASAFLLTIAWPSGEKLQGMKHRGYGT